MNADERERLIRTLRAHFIKTAKPGMEHERLKADLNRWAHSQGFVRDVSLESGLQPDVMRVTPDETLVFIGDAKDHTNETVDNHATLERIFSYIVEFAALLRGGIEGGMIAIATNNADEAGRWSSHLRFMTGLAGIENSGGGPVEFAVRELETGRTWIVHC